MKLRKKLIEVALPLDAINAASHAENQPFTRGHPRSLHIWWARMPLGVVRAVIFAQIVDDPSSRDDLSVPEQDQERRRLFGIIERLVKWGNTTDELLLDEARGEIRESWRRICADNASHPRAAELFDPDRLPAFHDPFAGGGALPLEAQRLGLEAHASDINPVAVLINKALIEIPTKFVGRSPVNPNARAGGLIDGEWKGAVGLAEDVLHYGKWMRDEAERRIGFLHPKIEITAKMVEERTDLKPYLGRSLDVIAWLWARTVKSPNPAFADVDVPLVSTFMLSTKKGKEAYVEPIIEGRDYRFTVKTRVPPSADATRHGTKLSGEAFRCLLSGIPIKYAYIDDEANSGRMGERMMAIVAQGDRTRVYLPPTSDMEALARSAQPTWKPDLQSRGTWASNAQGRRYGFRTFGDYFSARQLVALNTLSDLVGEVRERIRLDAMTSGLADNGLPLNDGGTGATAYAEAVCVYLATATSRWSDLSNTICTWNTTNQNIRALFARQGIQMSWDFAELAPFAAIASWLSRVESWCHASVNLPVGAFGTATQRDARSECSSTNAVISTDPPYYDNVSYADLSDFFYVWLRRMLRPIFPDLFATMAVPKGEELIVSPHRHESKEKAEEYFLDGMTEAMRQLAKNTHPAFPVTIYYAYKQSESKGNGGMTRTGWETFLDAVIRSGFGISGTWPVQVQRKHRSVGLGANALASSIVLVCRKRPQDAPLATRGEFVASLRAELPDALSQLQRGNIAPVDLAQAAIGPGMAIYTRYSQVLDARGKPVSVRDALALINQILDEVLAEQEGDFDTDTRWALAWFEQSGFTEGDFGMAETLSKAKNISVAGMVEAGVLRSGAGKVRLLRPHELPEDWVPDSDTRLIVWEAVHHLVRVHDKEGEDAAASLMSKLGPNAEAARELAYRLYRICDQKNRSQEALGYNALVQSWPEVTRLAQQVVRPTQGQMGFSDNR